MSKNAKENFLSIIHCEIINSINFKWQSKIKIETLIQQQ